LDETTTWSEASVRCGELELELELELWRPFGTRPQTISWHLQIYQVASVVSLAAPDKGKAVITDGDLETWEQDITNSNPPVTWWKWDDEPGLPRE
jgi:hypothetical protein